MKGKIIAMTMEKGVANLIYSKSSANQIGYALKWTIPTLMFLGGIIYALWASGLGNADIPTTLLQSPLFETTDQDQNMNQFFNMTFYCDTGMVNNQSKIAVPFTGVLGVNQTEPLYTISAVSQSNMPQYGCNGIASVCCKTFIINSVLVSPLVFIIAIMTLIGWFIFAVFGGVGLASIPYDLLNDFKHRTRPITRQV